MQLRTLQVTNYRSVEDSTPFKIDDLTALVGKNESGKTSILQALYKLHPVDSKHRYDVDREYPRRHLNEYKAAVPASPAVVVCSHWELEAEDLAAIHRLVGPKALKTTAFDVKKGYDDQRREQQQNWALKVDEQEALRFVLEQAALSEQEQAALAAVGPAPANIKELVDRLAKITTPPESLAKLAAHLKSEFSDTSAWQGCVDAVGLPEFVYFGNYDRLPGRINIDQLASKVANSQPLTRGDEIALAFLELAQLKLAEVQQAKSTEVLIAKLEGVSSRITKMIFKYWTQNRHLRIQVRVDPALPDDPVEFSSGKILSIRIENTHHEVTVPFDERSAGFVWFFSFLVYFWQIEKKHGDNLIILLDEPGLSLHARAQSDLLRYFTKELLPKHQVIFSTHSPFMIPADNILCARTVEDVIVEVKDAQGEIEEVKVLGTKVSGDVMSIDRDTLFPLQGALGYDLTQTLFVGKNTLLVEGPGDLVYLTVFSNRLRAKGRHCLDPRWTITPVRGASRMATFVTLLGSNKLNVTVLTDTSSKQQRDNDELMKKCRDIMKQGGVLTVGTYTSMTDADIEDLLGAELFCYLVNTAYGLKGTQMVAPVAGGGRILPHVEAHMRMMPPEIAEFDHYGPAEYLARNPQLLDKAPGVAKAEDQFEAFFKDHAPLIVK